MARITGAENLPDTTTRPDLVDDEIGGDDALEAIAAAAEEACEAEQFLHDEIRVAYKYGGLSLRAIADKAGMSHTKVSTIVRADAATATPAKGAHRHKVRKQQERGIQPDTEKQERLRRRS